MGWICESSPIMITEDALIGGEESSGFGYRGHIPERDGILSGLYFLDFMARTGKTPSELLGHLYSKVGPHHYTRSDIDFPAPDREVIQARAQNMPERIAGSAVDEVKTIDGYHYALSDGSWLLIRFSGTEPLLRIYSEAESLQRTREIITEARRLLQV